MSRVLRLAASGLASLAGCSVDQLEDIKIAVSEVMIALIEHGEGQAVEVRLVADVDSFLVRGRTAVGAFDLQHPDLVLCRTVLAGVGARYGIELVDGFAEIWASVDMGPAGGIPGA